jgi:hypothetical protein
MTAKAPWTTAAGSTALVVAPLAACMLGHRTVEGRLHRRRRRAPVRDGHRQPRGLHASVLLAR